MQDQHRQLPELIEDDWEYLRAYAKWLLSKPTDRLAPHSDSGPGKADPRKKRRRKITQASREKNYQRSKK